MAAKSKTTTKRNLPAVSGTVEHIDKDGTVTTVAADAPAPIPSEFAGSTTQLAVKRQVTVPVLQWASGAIIFSPLDPIKEGKELKNTRGGKANFGVARLMTIRGQKKDVLRTLIVGTVLEGELTENYPDNSYVGKWFTANKIAPNEAKGQRYATYQIMEIEKPADFE